MKILKKTMVSASLIIGFSLVLAGAYFLINHLKGASLLFIIGFSGVLYYTIIKYRESDKIKPFDNVIK
jgi:hypothetical protein